MALLGQTKRNFVSAVPISGEWFVSPAFGADAVSRQEQKREREVEGVGTGGRNRERGEVR